jgi:hypothetical protein
MKISKTFLSVPENMAHIIISGLLEVGLVKAENIVWQQRS